MNADRDLLEQVRLSLRDALEQLERSGAPRGIADHIELALVRLDSFVGMVDKWEAGNGSRDEAGD